MSTRVTRTASPGRLGTIVLAAVCAWLFFGEPVQAAVHPVPASIPADCSRNVEAELTKFIGDVAVGDTVKFPAGSCYAQGGRIEVRDKRDLTIDGGGATFKSSAANSGLQLAPNWLVLRGRNVRLTNMKIVGNFHLTGERSQQRVNEATVAGVGNQFNMGIGIYGGEGNSVTDSTIDNVFGDGIGVNVAQYVDGSASDPLDIPRDTHIERVKVTHVARHCFSPNQAIGFWLEDSEANDCWYGGFDAELDNVDQKLQDIHILRNTFDGFNMFGIVIPVAGNGTNTKDIEIKDNVFATRPDNSCNTTIEVGIYPTNPNTITNVRVENNTFRQQRHGLAVRFDHVVGGSIQNNTDEASFSDVGCWGSEQTAFSKLTNSSDVTVSGNRTPAVPAPPSLPAPSEASTPSDPPTAPEASTPAASACPTPTEVTVARTASDKGLVSWSHASATSYSVWLQRPGWDGPIEYSTAADGSPRTLFGLAAGYAYDAYVVARCADGTTSPKSTTTRIAAAAEPAAPPAAESPQPPAPAAPPSAEAPEPPAPEPPAPEPAAPPAAEAPEPQPQPDLDPVTTCSAPTNVALSPDGGGRVNVTAAHPGAVAYDFWVRNEAWSPYDAPIVWATLDAAPGKLFGMRAGYAYTIWVVAKCANGTVSPASAHQVVTVE